MESQTTFRRSMTPQSSGLSEARNLHEVVSVQTWFLAWLTLKPRRHVDAKHQWTLTGYRTCKQEDRTALNHRGENLISNI
jgi:hypothetical protein